MLDAHQLNVFLVAAENLNFTQAAQRLHMTQPSVSQHIQSLEQHFGVKLFIRAGRHIELSDAGIALVPMARELVRQSVHIDEAMASLKGEIYGHLQVSCSTTPGKYILPQLLARFHHMHPRVRVTCQVTSQTTAVRSLMDGDTHFALTSMPPSTSFDLEFRKFFSDPVCLIAPLDHPWAERASIDPEDLLSVGFILREESSGTFAAVGEELARQRIPIEKLENVLTLGNSEAIALAVQEGIGLGFVSRIVVTNLVAGRVAEIPIRGLEVKREIYLARHTRRPATSAQIAFWDFIAEIEDSERPAPEPEPSFQI